jgi:hypothetical protein
MDAAAHQVVHQVVARRDAVEHTEHAAAMLVVRHLLVAEIPGFAGAFA